MEQRPIKRDESLFGGGLLPLLIRQTFFCTLVGLLGFYYGAVLYFNDPMVFALPYGQTMAFLIVGWSSILHIFSVRSSKSVFKTPINNNIPLAVAAIAMIVLFGVLIGVPQIGAIFGLTPLPLTLWLVAAGLSIIPSAMRELFRHFEKIPPILERRRKEKEQAASTCAGSKTPAC
jgi:magnesium-transporting ATPase (P-type)